MSVCPLGTRLDDPCSPAPVGVNRFCEWPGYAARRSVSRDDWYAYRENFPHCVGEPTADRDKQ